jgi:tetratricopeptide (TPR) repeat protein
VLLRLERYQDAEDQFRHVLRMNKRYVPARVGLAWSLYHQGKKSEALRELKHVKWWAEKRGVCPIGAALHHLGRYYLLEEDFEQAIAYFHQAIDSSPDRYGNYWELGRALLAQKRYAEALTAFESARDRLPHNLSDESRAELEELIELARSKTLKN